MFADRLKQARKFKHYSQAELSRLLGVTQQAVGKWETGRSTPDPKTVARLAELLDTTADALLGLRQTVEEPNLSVEAVGRDAFAAYEECLIPVVGTVRAGYGALAFEEDYGKEHASVKDPQNYFYLVVKGATSSSRSISAPIPHKFQFRLNAAFLKVILSLFIFSTFLFF